MSSVAACRLQELQIYRLLHCVQARDTAQVKKLLRVGVHDLVNLTEPHEGKGVLHVAAVANNTDMIEFLMLHGACPDVQDKQGRTPVMLAAELGHDGVVTVLAEKHADMKLTDIEGKGEGKKNIAERKMWQISLMEHDLERHTHVSYISQCTSEQNPSQSNPRSSL